MPPPLPNSLAGPSNRRDLTESPPPERRRAFSRAAAVAVAVAALSLALAFLSRPSESGLPVQVAPPVLDVRLAVPPQPLLWFLLSLVCTLLGPLCLLCGAVRPERARSLLAALLVNALWIPTFATLALLLVA